MKIITIAKKLTPALMLVGGYLVSGAASAGLGSLNNLVLGYPQVSTIPGVAPVCGYDALAGVLDIKAEATSVIYGAPPTGTSSLIFNATTFALNGELTLSVNIDNGGNLQPGGSFEVTGYTGAPGTFCDPSCGPELLLGGTVTDYGIEDLTGNATTDQADFRIMPNSGSLMAGFAVGDDIGVTLTLEGSNFAGNFAGNWSCSLPKPLVGPVPPPLPMEQCDLDLVKTVTPDQVGPFAPMGDDDDSDSDSDSNHDGNGNGDTDDSDSDSSADSADQSHGHNRWNGSSYYWCSNPDHNDAVPDCGCKGKVSELVLQYNGMAPATVTVNRLGSHGTNLYPATLLQTGDQFTVNGSNYGPPGFQGTLGTSIEISIDGGSSVTLHTSCSQPIGAGLVAGDFEVISGTSKKLDRPLCPMPATPCAGATVTYSYTVTNNASPLTGVSVTDNLLGLIGTVDNMASGDFMTFTEEVCITETTTNIGNASGILPSGESCAAAPAEATVQVLLPPEPDPCSTSNGTDSDSDSHVDMNGNNDSDDSDSDSGDADCDADSDMLPEVVVAYEGCTPGYWKKLRQHKSAWRATDYRPGSKFDAIFGVDAAGNKGLLKSLRQGGRHSKGLGRHATAALLNASNPDINYFYTVPEVISIVQNAYTDYSFNIAKDMLKQQNDAGCPLN